MPSRSLILYLCVALALAPVTMVGAQNGQNDANRGTADVTFFGHVFGHGLAAPMPANTEAPIGEDNYGLGFISYCGPTDTPAASSCENDAAKRLALFSTAGFVDVSSPAEFQQEGAYSLLHNERGQTKDVKLDTSKSITANIYLGVDFHGWPVSTVNPYGTNCAHPHPQDVPCVYPYWGWDPGVQPGSVVTASLYKANLGEHGSSASEAPPVQEALASGDAELIAQGQWGPDTIINGLPGSPNVNQFTIDLGTPQVDTIPRDEDFFLVYGWHQEAAGQAYGTHTWRVWSGELFPPTFTMPVENAFDVERVIPNFAHGKMAILGVMNTPWGSYDIDGKSVELTIKGPSGTVTPEHISRFGSFSVAHGGHYLPINLTWIWDFQKEGLQPGEYTVTVSASNFQHSASASCTASFSLTRTSSGALTQDNVNPGVCGQQSASEEFLEDIQQGAQNDTGGT